MHLAAAAYRCLQPEIYLTLLWSTKSLTSPQPSALSQLRQLATGSVDVVCLQNTSPELAFGVRSFLSHPELLLPCNISDGFCDNVLKITSDFSQMLK